MSFVLTAVNVGFGVIFLEAFLKSFGISVAVSLPVTYIAVPAVKKLLNKVFGADYD